MSIESNNGFGAEGAKANTSYNNQQVNNEFAMPVGRFEQKQEVVKDIIQDAKHSDELVDREDTRRAAEALIIVAQNLNQDLQFSLESPETKNPVIQVVDRESGDIIRQIPSEEFLKLASRMQSLTQDEQIDSATGFLIDSRV